MTNVKSAIKRELTHLKSQSLESLLKARYDKLMDIGHFSD